jgi:RNase H-like domain found in reverse transcriptase/Integrase zinc binding domain
LFRFKCGRPLFLGAAHPIKVRTDHKNLQYFRQPQKITGRQARWIEYLQDFDYKLSHIPGHTNTVADLLSRRKDLNKEVNTDKLCILLDDTLFSNPEPTIRKLFLEDDIEKRRMVLQEIHDSPAGGHPGISNTWELVKQLYKGP